MHATLLKTPHAIESLLYTAAYAENIFFFYSWYTVYGKACVALVLSHALL